MILNGEGVTKDDEEAACNMRDCIALQLTQRPRGIQTLNIFWAARLRRVEVLRRTEWRRRDGSFLRRLGSMLMLNFIWVLLTKRAVALRRIQRRPCDGTSSQPFKGFLVLKTD